MTAAPALILFGHGARDPEWVQPLRAVRDLVAAAHPDSRVELAFLEFMSPDLPTRVAELVSAGVTQVTVLPMFIAQGGHLKRELPEMLVALRAAHPGLNVELMPAIGTTDRVIAAMAAQAADYLS
ncbi:sirohydrochlorin chelatase [Azovibrio restrictus]|uniref:sirohydrochlorin chelatase n=1 Tax=Azovibrio restrictus TaxID=146938 RepID=UPI0026F1C05A|nr:CbiX/SirB N-terminal domain-containing protein [Azovibrio restrictus]MDD3483956.1 CbiX/SirB N-terminal domain-containing protein [Azovibrio restrictus]